MSEVNLRSFNHKKKRMKKVLQLALLLVISASTLFSQKMRYEEKTDVFFGLNIGSTWHTSDVQNIDHGVRGLGFILGKSFNHDYGKVISFDLRFRGMYGQWNGLDTDTTSAIGQNPALSQYYNDYAVQNFRSTQFRAALELALHLNSFRERTGLDPYIFGGIGYTWTETAGNLLDDIDLPYDYGTTPNGSIIDNTYETSLAKDGDGGFYSSDSREVNLKPSIGFGLGYYFTNRFSMGFEHKTTFFLDDYFDGTIVNQDGAINGNNDLYHYTGIYARWYLKPADERKKPTPPRPTTPTTVVTPPAERTLPNVNFTLPSSSPHVTSAPTITLRANVEHVSSAQYVRFTQNGAQRHDFTFNSITNAFQSTVQLTPGQNIFQLRGTNDFGSDDATMIIVYELEQGQPPVVTITDPSTNPNTINSNRSNVYARIQNIDAKNQVSATLNGQPIGTSFNFNITGLRNFEKEFSLVPGANQIRVTATNEFGTDSDEITIIYDRKQEEQIIDPPVVSFSNPVNNNTVVSSPNFQIRGSVLNVNGSNNVSFVQNGSINANFTYSTTNKQFASNVVLSPGANVFQLIGTNSAGSDQKTVIITYDEPSPTPPIVSITNPVNNPRVTTNPSIGFNATVLNVNQRSGVTMKLNGQTFNNFNFQASNGSVSALISLQEGSNTIRITGTNNDGSDTKQTVVIYKKPILELPPVVTFINPGMSPITVEEETYAVKAIISNISSKQQSSVLLNGSPVSNYSFTGSNGMTSFDITLQEGANTVTVTGTNNAGSDSKTITILYKAPQRVYPPVVAFLNPMINPKTVYASSYAVQARVSYVSTKQQITLRINGVQTNNFTFDASSEQVNFTTSLVGGANSIEIKAVNDHGQDVATTTLIYKRPNPVNPPVVDIFTPIQDNYEVNTASTPVQATLLNVATVNDISVMVNGSAVSNFTFNTTTKVLNMALSLVEGENTVLITGNNGAGSDSDQRTIIYNKEKEVAKPYVTFINPSQPGQAVTYPTFEMKADVINVDSKDDIRVRFNGQLIAPNGFSYNTQSREVTFTANLTPGNNSFVVRGLNQAGAHEAGTNVLYLEPEPECETPEVVFTQPSALNSATETDMITIKALVHNVSSSNDITVFVNGASVGNFSYNQASHQLQRQIELSVGNNVVEIIAQTSCGRTDQSIFINYQPVEEPCENPDIEIVSPSAVGYSTQNESIEVLATVANVTNIQQLDVRLNGNSVNFNYDLGTHTVSANLPLQLGANSIVLAAANDCGQSQDYWVIQREECKKPVINISTTPVKNGETDEEKLVITGTITEVNSSQITVKHGRSNKSFVYNEATQNFTSEITLNEGVNTIVITVENQCGTTTETISVTYNPVIPIDPPTVDITTPASSPYSTSNASETVIAKVENVQLSNQVDVKLNGVSINFDFSANAGSVTFTADLQEGANSLEITVVNESGSASDEAIISYKKPVVILPPVLAFTNPVQDTVVETEGTITVTGRVANLTNINQLEIIVNDTELSPFSSSMNADGSFTFSVPVTLSASHHDFTITAIATNQAGSANDQVTIHYEKEEEEVPCEAEISVNFAENFQSINVESNQPITFVAFKYSDETVEEFPNLVGNTANLRIRDSQNRGKCIIGAWVVSGCLNEDQQNDYGIWFENTDYNGSCEEEPCEVPVISFLSPTSSEDKKYTLVVSVEHVNATDVSITHNGEMVHCSFDTDSSAFMCNVVLLEEGNTFAVTAEGCETVTQETEVTYVNPCLPMAGSLVFPSDITYTSPEPIMDINMNVENILLSDISASVNGDSFTDIQLQGTSLLLNNVRLSEGENTVTISAENECNDESITFTITYNAPELCGPRINPGNNEWQFCIVTPAGTFNSSDLEDPNFTYSGSASSVYFLPIAGGGNVTVNGSEYNIQPGQYYLFEGKTDVTVSSAQPGSNGHWQVCLKAFRDPVFGNGANRPASPCEKLNEENTPGNSSGNTDRPVIPNKTTEPNNPVTLPSGTIRKPTPTRTTPTTQPDQPTRTPGTIKRPTPTRIPDKSSTPSSTPTRTITTPKRTIPTKETTSPVKPTTKTKTISRPSSKPTKKEEEKVDSTKQIKSTRTMSRPTRGGE